MVKKFEPDMASSYISPNFIMNASEPGKFFKIGPYNTTQDTILKKIDADIGGKIEVYEDRVNGWFLRFSDELTKERDAGFVILMILFSQIEGNQQFRDGTSSRNVSTATMTKALRRILRTNYRKDPALRKIVDWVRNGLFHDGMTKKGLIVSGSITEHTLTTGDLSLIKVNPNLYAHQFKIDFENYIKKLKDKKQKKLRKNFEARWDDLFTKYN